MIRKEQFSNFTLRAVNHLIAFSFGLSLTGLLVAQDTVEWTTLGNDFAHTRSTPATQITPQNFGELEVAWTWDGASFEAQSGRATPSYINGRLYTVAGARRHVVAIDPKSGATIWSYREPDTGRWDYSMRADYGKGVGYANIDGRDVIYIISPGFFLTALDAETGRPLEGFGEPVPVEGFPETGVVDLLKDLGHPYDPYEGIPLERGYITSSSPPIIVNDVVVVGNSAEQGYHQSRIENVPGDILGYDARSGEFLWKFNVIPQPGEYGHETWQNDSWQYTGDISSWAPISADPELGQVFIPTNGVTIDYYGGHHPGDNLYGTSLISLDARTGERVWHFQMVHHDIWNFDTPTAPILLDTDAGPIVAQATKQGYVYVFNRETGEPIWPIEERPVPQTDTPGEWTSPTQPFPTKPAPFDRQGFSEDDLIDFTPEIRARAAEVASQYRMGPIYAPPSLANHPDGTRGMLSLPTSTGGSNWEGGALDPETGHLYIGSYTRATVLALVEGGNRSDMDYIRGGGGAQVAPGVSIVKPPWGRITAIDLTTGEHAWMIANGDTRPRIAQALELELADLPRTGKPSRAGLLVTSTLLFAGEGISGDPVFRAHDKATGNILAEIEIPGTQVGLPMSYMYEGKQYVVVAIGRRGQPAEIIALALPDEE